MDGHGAGLQDARYAQDAYHNTRASRCLARGSPEQEARQGLPRRTNRATLPHRRTRYVQAPQSGNRVGRPPARSGNRQDRPPGRRRRSRDLRRDRRTRHRRFDEGAEARPRLLPADRQLPGKDLCRRQDPRRLFQARRPSEREGNAGFPPHRPPDPPALRRWLQERHAGRRHRSAA